MINMPCGSQ